MNIRSDYRLDDESVLRSTLEYRAWLMTRDWHALAFSITMSVLGWLLLLLNWII